MLTIAPLLSVAVSVKVPVVVPASRLVLLTPTVTEVPLPVSGAGVESDNQGALVVAAHVTGREHVPDSLSWTIWDAGEGCP